MNKAKITDDDCIHYIFLISPFQRKEGEKERKGKKRKEKRKKKRALNGVAQ